jgi:hypothetical protein
MAVHATAGTTRRLRWKDLTHLTNGAVTSGATVTFRIIRINVDGTTTVVVGPVTGTATGDDWYTDVTIPPVLSAGQSYVINVVAVAGGATEELEVALKVEAARP